jgi:hypothetical protein
VLQLPALLEDLKAIDAVVKSRQAGLQAAESAA